MRKTRLTSWATAPLAVWATVQASPVWAQVSGFASGASGVNTSGLPPRVPYLLIIAIGVVAVIALVLALKALSEVRALKNELNGMKNR